jgi:hypothetical protein
MARGVAVGACGRVRVKDINEMKICTGIIIMNKAEKITPINTSHFLQKLQNVVSRGVLETIKRWGTEIIIVKKAEKISLINTSHFLQMWHTVVSRGVLKSLNNLPLKPLSITSRQCSKFWLGSGVNYCLICPHGFANTS